MYMQSILKKWAFAPFGFGEEEALDRDTLKCICKTS